MNEKPFRLEMGFNEAVLRLSRVTRPLSSTQGIDLKGKSSQTTAATKKSQQRLKLVSAARKKAKQS